MKQLMFVLALALIFTPTFATPAPDELTFSLDLTNPKEGPTVWTGQGEYLIGLGGTFLLGPSVSMFDLGEVDGGTFGIAAKWRIGKTSGFWLGGRVAIPQGDLADQVKSFEEARAGIDFGDKHAFATFYASQTWTNDESGQTVDPEGTSVFGGIGWRFGK